MIASWMVYVLVIALIVSVAALIAERIARLRRWPGRWIWISALLLSIALPMLFGLQSARSSVNPAAALATLAAVEEPPVYARLPIVGRGRRCYSGSKRHRGHVAASRLGRNECARAGNADDGMDAAATSTAISCRQRDERGANRRH